MPENPGARRASTSAKLSRSISSGCHRVEAFAAGAVLPLKSPSSKMRNGLPGSTTEADECALGLTSRCTEPKEDLMVTAANSSCRVSVANYQSYGAQPEWMCHGGPRYFSRRWRSSWERATGATWRRPARSPTASRGAHPRRRGCSVIMGRHAAAAFALHYPVASGGGRPLGEVHRSEEHTSELQSLRHLVCRLLLE